MTEKSHLRRNWLRLVSSCSENVKKYHLFSVNSKPGEVKKVAVKKIAF
jgi:hypothetical protein